MKPVRLILALGLAAAIASAAAQESKTVYNSIPKPLPGNVASEGPESYAFASLGDGVKLAARDSGNIGNVTVVLSSWACQNGTWFEGTCSSASGATFTQPITISLYSVTSTYSSVYLEPVPTPLALIGTITEQFTIPYRPSVAASCGDDTADGYSYPTQWYSTEDKACYNGIAIPVTIDFSGAHIPLPHNSEVIVAVSFNTTNAGPNPIGTTACNSTSGGCPYDSLNISTDGNGPSGLFHGVGSLLDYNGIFADYIVSANACPGNTVTGVLALDAPCFTGYHPQIMIEATGHRRDRDHHPRR
jgi:hypothetical protein